MAVNETVNLTIRIRDEATRALSGARAGVARLNAGFEAMKRAIFSLKGLLLGLGAGLAIRRIAREFNELAGEIDRAAKNAKRFGIDVGTLTGLSFGAGLSGVSPEQLGVGLRQLAKNAQDFSRNTGEARVAFQQLGIEVLDQSGNLRSAEELLGEIANRFATMPDGANKTATAMRLFGESGAALIPFLNAGSAGIKTFREEAERLGIVIDERTAAAAERFNDSLTRFQASMRGVRISLAQATFEPLAIIFEQLAGAIADNRDEIARLAGDSIPRIKGLVTAFGTLAIAINEAFATPSRLVNQFGLLIAQLELFEARARGTALEVEKAIRMFVLDVRTGIESAIEFLEVKITNFLARIFDMVNDAARSMAELASRAGAGGELIDRLMAGGDIVPRLDRREFDADAVGQMARLRAKVLEERFKIRQMMQQGDETEARQRVNALTAEIIQQGEAAGRTREEIFGWIDSLHQMIDNAASAGVANDELRQSFDEVASSVQVTAAELERMRREAILTSNDIIGGFKLALEDFRESLALGNQAAMAMSATLQRFQSDVGNAFLSIMDGSKSAKEALADFVKAFIANIMAMIAAMLAAIVVKAILFPFDLPFTTAAGSAAGSAAAGAAAGAAGAGIGISTQGGGLTGISANEFARQGGTQDVVVVNQTTNNISAVDAGSFKRMLTANPEALTPAMVQNFNSSLALQTVFRG